MEGSASKTVRNQVNTGEDVVRAADTHTSTLAEALFERQKVPDDEKLTKEELERYIGWLGAELRATNAWLWESELAYTAEQGDDAPIADARKAQGEQLESDLRSARNNAHEIGGRSALRTFGMASPPPRDMAGLAKYAENAIQMMRDNPTPLTRVGMTFDPPLVAGSLAQSLGSYDTALEADKTEARELENAKGVRDNRQGEWKVSYRGISKQLEGMFEQAGRPDLAERVRPTTRRATGVEPADEADDADAPTPQPAEPVADEA